MSTTSDTTVEGLTVEQQEVAGSTAPQLFIEAGPGTGKTTVSAYRFGVERFHRGRGDHRAVVATSFTRAATWHLRKRVLRMWGTQALAWPNRIVTLDSIMVDLVHDLLEGGLLTWPSGHTTLQVQDSWNSFGGKVWNRTDYELALRGGSVRVTRTYVEKSRSSVPATVTIPLLQGGLCTHSDIRTVLELALGVPTCARRIAKRLTASIRSLIVDEVFDANDLDVALIECALAAGVRVTLVGDPWQALYLFRGARPDLVHQLLARSSMLTVPLTRSFRWRTAEQRDLANDLRTGQPVLLPATDLMSDPIEVALALFWKPLWGTGDQILPLAFQSFGGGYEEGAATLLLNQITRTVFSEDATYLRDALTVLAISDPDIPRQLETPLHDVVETLRVGTRAAVIAAYNQLVTVVADVSPRQLRAAHSAHYGRLGEIARRLQHPAGLVPGLTAHQAKGREWNRVGVRLSDGERQLLSRGLQVSGDTDRKLYVACTRARFRTTEI